jgi:hypothetical protein
MGDAMRDEYDFSQAVRGKFFREGAELRLPIYLDAELQAKVEQIASRKGLQVADVVIQLVRKEVELIAELT